MAAKKWEEDPEDRQDNEMTSHVVQHEGLLWSRVARDEER